MNAVVAIYICKLLPDYLFKSFLQGLFKILYKVEIRGLENFEKAGKRAVIVGNHVSLLDPPLLAAFLPGRPIFAVNTHVMNWWWVKPFLKLVDAFGLEQLILVTTKPAAAKEDLSAYASKQGITELGVPKTIIHIDKMPVLGTGKTDYLAIQKTLYENHIKVAS